MGKNWHRQIMDFLADPEAAVATEYALLIGLIAMVIFGAVQFFGTTMNQNLYQASLALLPFGS